MAVPHIPHIGPSVPPPPTTIFKVGDPVVCIDGIFDKNIVYEVEYIGASGLTISLKGEGPACWAMRRFELAKNQIVRNILNDL